MGTEIAKIQFHGAELFVQRGDGPETTFVAMRPVVEGMGLDWASQFTKLKAHPVLAPTVVEITMVAEDGRERAMTALPLNRLHFWLATLHPNKIKDPHIREKVLIFQTEAADALFEKFFGRAIARAEGSDANVVGGVVKGVVAKQHREVLVPEIRAMFSEALAALSATVDEARQAISLARSGVDTLVDRNAAATFNFAGRVGSSEIMSMAGVPEEGRARGAAQRVTRLMLREYSARAERVPRYLNQRQPWLFDKADAREWLEKKGGAQLIRQEHDAHQARRRRPGQSELKLV